MAKYKGKGRSTTAGQKIVVMFCIQRSIHRLTLCLVLERRWQPGDLLWVWPVAKSLHLLVQRPPGQRGGGEELNNNHTHSLTTPTAPTF